ncbi:hypothetical protein GCM10008956_01940 [Deinococcus arenae]|uniref:Uncharacterized protein n=1 Tax=Deinococcus arenae TaxID=1452751 RepID=A0A8H9GHU4_9DEIO|nr:hypothetical protein [Deinococcus arenae]AWT36066.1 hypothetical protein DM785_11215 [Deinococcus actinosclerus]GGM29555.1 hypothetical protein GCM10008956_01940 [Deinococcus arenae]
MRRLLLLFALGWGAAPAQTAADPWPRAPVLTRLFVLASGRQDSERLIRTLDLTVAQVRELQRLAGSERAYAQAARPLGTAAARALNVKLAAMNAEKDRKVRRLLGRDYDRFRVWVRAWWEAQVRQAQRP